MTLKDLTTLLDLVGLLIILTGLSLAVWPYFPPASFIVGGAGLLAISWLTDRGAKKGRES